MTANVKSTRRDPVAARNVQARLLALGAVSLLCATLAGCTRAPKGPDELQWARAALERNDRLQVVASDPQARTFTVRLKDSGELRIVPVDQLVAGPAAAAGSARGAAAAGATDSAAESAAPAGSGGPGTGANPPETGAESARNQESGPAAAPGDADAATGAAADEPARSAASDTAATAGTMPPHAQSAADAKPGSVLASGPGYSIKASGSRGAAARVATVARGLAVERLHDPIICQGSRLLHIDNRNLQFDGDAVSAEDGCELHITNTHISAKGIAVLARAANVHIANSEIEGDSGAIDASDGAQIYAEASTFKGLTRRLARSAFHDLGGNVWN